MTEGSELQAILRDTVPGATRVEVTDTTGAGDHFEAVVVAHGFKGKTRVERHRIVYSALADLIGRAVHAISLKTLTPEEDSNP